MIVRKRLKFSLLVKHLHRPLIYFTSVSSLTYLIYETLEMKNVYLPTSITAVMGTALAIFIGFRNSSSYDRWWEARKIWGGIVNSSRTFGRQITTLVTLHQVNNDKINKDDLIQIHKEMVFRHIAWINALRLQLRNKDDWLEVNKYLSKEEWERLKEKSNKATQLIQKQAERFTELLELGFIEDFRHIQFDNTLTEFYNLQGKAERIKNTPLPRQYDFFINMFMWCFVTLLPLTLINPLETIGISWTVIPLTILIAMCFYLVSAIAAYNEDPFEN
ncbi:bestrophin family protein [Sediminitomix flava]|uniref:Putative membrane protein n=1 Tax=Sediminitomix flava TaxID=379075 RepID=A0A315Z6T6_SEDFL|nr:bestrophin family ion channel [Sediminitomix flava]PWJ37987.1 putative membrane protein [Sediminitomix flava]